MTGRFRTTWQFRTTGPPRNLSSTPQLSRCTCPPGHLAVSPSRRRRQGIIPLRSAVHTCCSALGDCFIFLYVRSPSVDTPFRYSALVPHRFLHTSRPLSTINRVTVISFVRAVYYWLYFALLYVFCSHFSSSKLFCFSHRVINFES